LKNGKGTNKFIELDALALRMIFLTGTRHFKLEEIMTPSNSKDEREISGEVGIRKWDGDLSKTFA